MYNVAIAVLCTITLFARKADPLPERSLNIYVYR